MDKNLAILLPEEQSVIEKLPVSFAVFLLQGDKDTLLAASDGFCRMFQTKRENLTGPLAEILNRHIHPDDIASLHADLESACLSPDGKYGSVCRVRLDGEAYLWFAGSGCVSQRADGAYLLYLSFTDVHDITEQSMAKEREKLRQDALLSDILETTKTAIFWKDTDRRFLGANRAFLDYYGFPDESVLIGKNDEEMGWHIDPDPYKNDEMRVLRDGISTYRVPGTCMARGQNRNIVASKSPLVLGGKIVGLVGSFEDVTTEARQKDEIVRLNSELEKRISDHDELMNISEVCIVKINLSDFTFLDYNDAMCRMIGYTREAYEARFHHNMGAFFTGEYRGELEELKKAAMDAVAAGRKSITINLRVPTKDGFVWIGGAGSFSDFEPETKRPRSMFAVYRDVSDVISTQKKLELAEIQAKKAAMLEQQNQNMRRMIDGVPSGLGAMYLTDGVPSADIQMSRYFTERIDIAANETGAVDRHAFLRCIHPEDRERCGTDFQNFIAAKTLMTAQYRFRSRGGGYIWGSVRGTVVRTDEHTEIAYFIYTNIDEMKTAEARLRESQRFYLEVVRAAKLSTWEYDIPAHTIKMSDDRTTREQCTRLNLPEVIRDVPNSLIGLIDEEDQEKFLSLYRDVELGKDVSCDVWYKPVNGREPRCERVTYISLGDGETEPARSIGFAQNITAEKKVEERYQREIGYLRQTDENNLLAKGHYNLTQNVVLEYSTKNDRVFRVSPGTAYDEAAEQFEQLLYIEQERREAAEKLSRKKLIQRYQHGEMQTGIVYRCARSGQMPVWVSMNIHVYMMPETGDLECFTYAYNITEKMESDEIMGLIADEEFDYIGLIFAETNQFEFIKKSPVIRFPEMRVRTGYDVCCDYVRKNFVNEDECSQFDAAVSLDNITAGLEKNGRHVSTYRRTEPAGLTCKQLDFVWLDRTARIILVVRSDVTAAWSRDQKQLAQIEAAKLEADRANEAKSAFLASMSHDLRTPLSGVLGFTELARKERDAQKIQDYLDKIDAAGKLLLDLVSDTLELSRIESGKAVLEPEAVMPGELIPAVVTALRPAAALRGIELSTHFENREDKPFWCDKLKVQKIALNLISNAIKYTPAGGTVSVGLVPARVPGCTWALIVEDTGIGMSEAFMQRMYEPFAQEKRSESVKTPGTGLGLSIVRHYVDLMSGKIEVTSRLHKGTRWVVSLPIYEVAAGTARHKDAEVAAESLAGKRVLLCEDNDMNTEIATMLLRDKNILVETAENGAKGVKRFEASAEGYYDAILMDIRMPVMDGNTATKKIRAMRRPDAKQIPIIAMTADAFEESVRESKKAGMNGYITKPIEPEKLFRTLAELLP